MSVHYSTHGEIGVFTLDNGKVNAITPPMHKEFHDHLKDFLHDPKMRVGILTGSGNRAFSGGDDVKRDWNRDSLHETLVGHFRPSTEADRDHRPGWERNLYQLERYKPIVGALNGPALGMGFIYAMNFMDIRIATPNAYLAVPEISYGMGGVSGSTQLWRHLPPAVAMNMALMCEKLTADEALRFGVYNKIVEPGELMPCAMEHAERIAAHPEIGVRVEMEAFYRSMDLSRSDNRAFMTHLYRLQRAAYLTADNTSGNPLDPNSPEQSAGK